MKKILFIFVSLIFLSTNTAYADEWLVKWDLNYLVPIPCPDSGPSEYGTISMISCLVFHSKSVTDNMNKTFATKEAADDFIKNMPMCNGFSSVSGCCDNVKKYKIGDKNG